MTIFVTIDYMESVWVSDTVVFSIPDSVSVSTLEDELRFALAEIEEEGISVDTDAPTLNEMILNRAAEKLGACWAYVRGVQFKYAYNGEWKEE